jgi:hypothetical protein
MGSLTGNPAYLGSFQNQIYPNGLDLGRCVIHQDLGVFYAAPGTTFRQGQFVKMTSTGIQVCSAKADVYLGLAKWTKADNYYAVAVDEPVTLVGTTVMSLKHANLVASTIQVRSVTGMTGGTAYTGGGTDYTVNTTNGTLVRVGGGAIADGQTVFASYTWTLSASDLDFQGRNFWNFTDDVSVQDNRVTIITDWSVIFTTQYDSSQAYAVGGAIYMDASGRLSSDSSASAQVVGSIIQVPSATDPFLGVVFKG